MPGVPTGAWVTRPAHWRPGTWSRSTRSGAPPTWPRRRTRGRTSRCAPRPGCGSCRAGRATTGLAPSDWPRFREYVRRALADGPLTRSELIAALRRSSRYRHVGTLVAEGNDTLLKPLTWQGDMGLGPVRDGEATFLGLDHPPRLGRHPRPRRGRADGGRGVRRHPRPDHTGAGARLVRQGARCSVLGPHPLAGPDRRPARDGHRRKAIRSWCSGRTSTRCGRRRPQPRYAFSPAAIRG